LKRIAAERKPIPELMCFDDECEEVLQDIQPIIVV
jgi:hypothetical protein